MTEKEEITEVHNYLKIRGWLKFLGYFILIAAPWLWLYLLYKWPFQTIIFTLGSILILSFYLKLKYNFKLFFDRNDNNIFPK
jgi:hypothetical protein